MLLHSDCKPIRVVPEPADDYVQKRDAALQLLGRDERHQYELRRDYYALLYIDAGQPVDWRECERRAYKRQLEYRKYIDPDRKIFPSPVFESKQKQNPNFQ